MLDEPDNYLDVPAKRWLEERLVESPKTVLFVSHDRELLDRVATRIATLEPSSSGNTVWVHPGRFSTYEQARADRNARLEELRKRWDEEHAKIKALVVMYRQKAAYNSDMASRLQAAETPAAPVRGGGPARRRCRCGRRSPCGSRGGRTAKRAVVATALELKVDGGQLMRPFDTEIWFGERVGVLGSNGSGKSHFLRLLAAGGSDPDREHEPVGDIRPAPVEHAGPGRAGLPGATRLVRADARPRRPARAHAARDPPPRRRPPRRDAARPRRPRARPLRPGQASEQTFDSLSGGQQARLQILLLELSGATLLLLDEPTDNLDLHSAEALEDALDGVRGHRARGDARPVVRARAGPVPRLPVRRPGRRVGRAGLGRGPGHQAAIGGMASAPSASRFGVNGH